MLAILTATPEEFAAAQAQLGTFPETTVTHGGTQFYVYAQPLPLVLARTEMGKVNAARTTATLLSHFPITKLVFLGVAGRVDYLVPRDSLLCGWRVATVDYGLKHDRAFTATPVGTFPPHHPDLTIPPFVHMKAQHFFKELEPLLQEVFPRVVRATLATADYFLACPNGRQELLRRHGAHAIDMESAAIVETAERYKVPALIFRTLSDDAGIDSGTSYDAEVEATAATVSQVIPSLLKFFGSDAKITA